MRVPCVYYTHLSKPRSAENLLSTGVDGKGSKGSKGKGKGGKGKGGVAPSPSAIPASGPLQVPEGRMVREFTFGHTYDNQVRG